MTDIVRVRKKNVNKRCVNCGGASFIEDHVRGESICASCGLVISERTTDRGPE